MHNLITWFARNGVAANLLMAAIAIAGIYSLVTKKIPLEVFPEFESNIIKISVPYRGSTPEEVEESVVIRIEEAIAEVEGIERITSFASENSASIRVEVHDDYDRRDVLNDVKSQVDSISTLPELAERPSISLSTNYRSVIGVVLYGDLNERDLKTLGEQVREQIASLPEVTDAQLQGVRPYEIVIEIDEDTLRRYGLSFDTVARALRNSSIDVSAGTLKTAAGEIALRTKGRAYDQQAFEDIVIRSREDGVRITLADIATVSNDFNENPFIARFNGQRCVLIAISREGNQSAITIAADIKTYLAESAPHLPDGVGIDYWGDRSKIVKGRLSTLIGSGWKSMVLVFLMLTLFLRPSLAFWVVIGIPVCFLGALALMPYLGVSINVVSLFAFILVLGVVVDDAIVCGENIYTWNQRGIDAQTAAIEGSKEVAVPVIFGVLTTMLAFVPMMLGSGFHGKWQGQIAIVVIAVLAFSLIESKLILPSHLAHSLREKKPSFWQKILPTFILRIHSALLGFFNRIQRFFSRGLELLIEKIYQPLLHWTLEWRYLTLAFFVSILILFLGLIAGGRISRVSFPRIESETVTCKLTMQEGTPFHITQSHILRIEETVRDLQKDYLDENGDSMIEAYITSIGGQGLSSSRSRGSQGQSHLGEVVFTLTPPEKRSKQISSVAIVKDWRQRIGEIIGAKELFFRAEMFRGRDPIDIQLTGPDPEQLTDAASRIGKQLTSYTGLFDISDSLDQSRAEIQLRIKPEAEQFGLTMADLARQVRQAFFGEEIQRLQRGRDEVRVMMRYPEDARRSLASLDHMRIRTSNGEEVPFTTVAQATIGRSFPRIQRIDRHRALNIRADADKKNADLDAIRLDLSQYLQQLMRDYPGMRYSFEGEARDEREANTAMLAGILLIVFGIYAMLAIPFRSYVQPLIVMSVIPFGLIGAVLGHLIEGHSLSKLSEFGMLALSGVVVNDSLVLVDFINRKVKEEGLSVFAAVQIAGTARFRAILLTSITTFAGLYPLLQLKSTQAQILIPMAISLGYGILFATIITLFLVPINYLILEDIKSLYQQPSASPKPSTMKKKSP
ncbi:MAG: efflux RND transporter permease subunit [Verrucomicrobiales bacterium]|nr:efflux RND transporter permease subunit [Verrucomicrobiales bacterium]